MGGHLIKAKTRLCTRTHYALSTVTDYRRQQKRFIERTKGPVSELLLLLTSGTLEIDGEVNNSSFVFITVVTFNSNMCFDHSIYLTETAISFKIIMGTFYTRKLNSGP